LDCLQYSGHFVFFSLFLLYLFNQHRRDYRRRRVKAASERNHCDCENQQQGFNACRLVFVCVIFVSHLVISFF
jgi:hypothetical protein